MLNKHNPFLICLVVDIGLNNEVGLSLIKQKDFKAQMTKLLLVGPGERGRYNNTAAFPHSSL